MFGCNLNRSSKPQTFFFDLRTKSYHKYSNIVIILPHQPVKYIILRNAIDTVGLVSAW